MRDEAEVSHREMGRLTAKELREHSIKQRERAMSLPTQKDLLELLSYFEGCIDGINHLIEQEKQRRLPPELLPRRNETLITLENELRKAKSGKKVYENELKRRQYLERVC